MKKRLLITLCSALIAILSIFISPKRGVFASEDVTKPTITGIESQIDAEYQVGEEMIIDKTAIILSDDVTTETALRNTFTLKVYTASMAELPDISEDEGFFVFEFSASGSYSLAASITDDAGNVCEVSYPITVISDSAVNAKYEKGFALGVTDFTDSKLYAAILEEVERFAESRGERFTGDTLYSEMLLFPTFTEINISNGNITSLDGLENLRLDYLEKISITSNKITEIKPDYFEDSENLKEINFASNQITTVELPSLRNLEKVNFASNKLTTLDLSNCMGDEVDINLAGNDFVKLDDIELPRADGIKLNLIGNNLESIDDAYFNETKFKINIGVQGIKDIENPSATDSTKGFRFYRTNIEGLGVRVYNNALKVPVEVKSVTDADIAAGKNFVDVVLPIGEYEYVYILDGEEVYSKYDATKNFYLPQEFVVKPTVATYKLEHKGEMYDSLGKVTGAVKIHLTSPDLEKGTKGKIMYSVNLGEWVEGDLVDCSAGGTFSVRVKVVCGDYESEEMSIFLQTSLNAVIPDVVMFFVILFLGIMLFAVLVPIISKKFFRK